MNALAHWNQFKELEALHNSLGSLFGRPQVPRPEGHEETPMRVAEWTPLVDISEDDGNYVVSAELPGTKREDVTVELEDDMLTIRGEKRNEREEKKEKRRFVERSYGTFSRSFTLPSNADRKSTRLNSSHR